MSVRTFLTLNLCLRCDFIRLYLHREFLGPVTDVLDGLFGLMSPHMIMTKYWRNLADGLAEQVPHQIQTSVLRQLQRISKDSKVSFSIELSKESSRGDGTNHIETRIPFEVYRPKPWKSSLELCLMYQIR